MIAIGWRGFTALLIAVAAGHVTSPALGFTQCGKASWYEFRSRTANGELANPHAFTAAHRTLPFGTVVQVQNLRNGRSVRVRINDRGPWTGGRVIDVTRAAAQRLGFVRSGTTRVRISAGHGARRKPSARCR